MDSIVQAISNRVPRYKGWTTKFGGAKQKKKKKHEEGEDDAGDVEKEKEPQTVVGPALSLLRTRKQRSAKLGTRVVIGSIQAYNMKKSKTNTGSEMKQTHTTPKKEKGKDKSSTRRKKTRDKPADQPKRKKSSSRTTETGEVKRMSKKDMMQKKRKKRLANLFVIGGGVRSAGGSIRSVSKRSKRSKQSKQPAAQRGHAKKPKKAGGMMGSMLSMIDEDIAKTREEQPLDPTAREMQELHDVYQELQGSLNSKKLKRRVRNKTHQDQTQEDLVDLEEAASIINAGYKKTSFKPGRSRSGQTRGAIGFSTHDQRWRRSLNAARTAQTGEGGEGEAANKEGAKLMVHDGGCMLDFSSPAEKAAVAAARPTGPRKLPALFFKNKGLTRLLEKFVYGGRKCPELVLIDGPSGCGKTWALNQIVDYWKQCTSPANVLTNENFEQAVAQGLPFPNDTSILLALDDVDALMPKMLEYLKKLLVTKNKELKRDSHGMHILLTATDIFAQPRHDFLKKLPKRVSMYRPTFYGPLKMFVDSLKLRPKPPDGFVRQAIQLCNGNLHRLLNMLRCHRSTKTLAAGDDSFTIYQEQDLFKRGKLSRPPSEKCAFMTVCNAPENVCSLAVLAELTDRFSESLSLHDPWMFQVSDLRILGKEKQYPSKYMSLNTDAKKLRDILPDMCRFFKEWGFETTLSTMQERLDAMLVFWTRERAGLKKNLHESRRILVLTKLSVDYLKSMDGVMHDRQRAFKARNRDIDDELGEMDEMQLKFLMG
jgi:hypothetical protein